MGKPIRVPIYFILFIGDSWDHTTQQSIQTSPYYLQVCYRKKGSCNRNKSRAQNNAERKLVFQPIPSFLH